MLSVCEPRPSNLSSSPLGVLKHTRPETELTADPSAILTFFIYQLIFFFDQNKRPSRRSPAWNRNSCNTALNKVPLKNSCHSVKIFVGEPRALAVVKDSPSTSCDASLTMGSFEAFSSKKRATVQKSELIWQHSATHFSDVVRIRRFSSQVCQKTRNAHNHTNMQ